MTASESGMLFLCCQKMPRMVRPRLLSAKRSPSSFLFSLSRVCRAVVISPMDAAGDNSMTVAGREWLFMAASYPLVRSSTRFCPEATVTSAIWRRPVCTRWATPENELFEIGFHALGRSDDITGDVHIIKYRD